MVAISGRGLNLVAMLYLPVIMLVEYVLALGMAFLTSSLTVYLRDLEYLSGIITMAWQFLTPIMYSVEIVPKRLLPLFFLNPMTPIIVAYRDILYERKIPQLSTLVHAAFFGVFMVAVGWLTFSKLKRHFAEEM